MASDRGQSTCRTRASSSSQKHRRVELAKYMGFPAHPRKRKGPWLGCWGSAASLRWLRPTHEMSRAEPERLRADRSALGTEPFPVLAPGALLRHVEPPGAKERDERTVDVRRRRQLERGRALRAPNWLNHRGNASGHASIGSTDQTTERGLNPALLWASRSGPVVAAGIRISVCSRGSRAVPREHARLSAGGEREAHFRGVRGDQGRLELEIIADCERERRRGE